MKAQKSFIKQATLRLKLKKKKKIKDQREKYSFTDKCIVFAKILRKANDC